MNNSYEKTELDFSSITFIFAKSYTQGFYMYGINSLDNLTLIKKDELIELVEDKLQCKNYDDLYYVMSRNLPFLYDNSEKILKKFIITNPTPTKEDINKIITKDFKEKNTPPIVNGVQSIYNNLFGSNSTFFRS
jgi:hypothetical protein